MSLCCNEILCMYVEGKFFCRHVRTYTVRSLYMEHHAYQETHVRTHNIEPLPNLFKITTYWPNRISFRFFHSA